MQPRRFERYRTTEEYSAGRRPRHLQAGTANRQGFAGRLISHGARGIMPVPVPDNRDVHGCKRLQEVHKERDCRPNRDPCRAGSASKLLCWHGQREHRAAAAGSCCGDCHASIVRCWLAARQPVLAHRTTQDRWCKTTAQLASIDASTSMRLLNSATDAARVTSFRASKRYLFLVPLDGSQRVGLQRPRTACQQQLWQVLVQVVGLGLAPRHQPATVTSRCLRTTTQSCSRMIWRCWGLASGSTTVSSRSTASEWDKGSRDSVALMC